MATSESAAAGAESGTPGSPVPRAAAVTVLAEEPSTGLFPAKPEAGTAAAPPSGSGTPATVSASATPAATKGEKPSRTQAGAEAEAEARTEAEEQPEAETAPEAATATVAAVATTGAATSAETETETAKATATTTGARRTGVLPLGRPGKPLIAAAVAGGLVLVGVPFLISGLSGSGDDTSPPSALAPVGSRMGPDGSGPGFVPGRQNAPGDKLPESDGEPSAGSGTGGSGTGRAATGGIHEAGTKSLATGTGEVAKDAKAEKNDKAEKHATPSASKSSAAKDSAGKPADKPVSTEQERVAPVTYSHFIGPGCDTPGFATSDRWRKGGEGWVGSTGSQTSYGCSGFYYSVPLSNSTTKSTGYAQWKFPTGSVTKGSCQVSVYIPNVKNISRVGGNPAHYAVHRYFEAKPSTQIGTFEINQTSHLGQWINAGTFPVSTGKISVVLENRGRTSGNRHAAAAPIKVNCTAS
ncbi:hypothetical protein ACFV6Z_12615 [Streptomyces sp. NPDC059818]|uniref:hypothetical protein n=1 Tax=Streptomyces sp. NPDC059818 TaxID=3346962 RepID=UPI00364A80CC